MNSKKVFFKIIVPNYNNMPYIKKCLDSILQQTFKDFFVVVVDDMSTDCSDKFCEAYERIYPDKMKLLRLEKKGYVGAARNRGLEWNGVESEYIWFVDSDDWLYDNNVLQKMHDKIITAVDIDILRVRLAQYSKTGLDNKKSQPDLKYIIENMQYAPQYNCINTKFSNITFQDGISIYDDVFWFTKILDKIDKSKVIYLENTCCVYNKINKCNNILSDTNKKIAKKQLEAVLSTYKPTAGLAQSFIDKVLNLNYKTNLDTIDNTQQQKVIVTMTSWKMRIQNCVYVINKLLQNTVKPDVIYLNLSTEEFPNKNKDLPSQLVDLSIHNSIVKINWVDGPNTKSMKKVFPILQYLNDNDIIIICDDDLDIPINFIQIRLKEFNEHGQLFPISGGTNPKYHLNLPLYNIKYNSLAASSIFTKKMLNGYEKIWSKEIWQTYKDDTIHTLLFLSNGYYPIPSEYLSTYSGTTKQKIQFYNAINGMGENKIWKSDKETIDVFINKFNKVMPYSYKQSLFNIVLFDSFDVAGDNAEALYRIVRKQYPWIKMTFLISKKCKDWKRLEQDKFNLYPFEGNDINKLLQNASFILWSKDTSIYNQLRKYKEKSIFMSHGRTSLIYDCRKYYNVRINNCASYVICTSEEEARTIQNYTNNHIKTLLTGFPRHDIIFEQLKIAQQKNRKKQVLISFHYRSNLDANETSFKNSEYLKGINKLLNSNELKSLSKDFDIVFITHARFKKYAYLFNIPDHIKIKNDEQFQNLFIQSDFLITDFSSTSFEFAYMNKPSFIYIPDMHNVTNNLHQYHIENIKKYQHLIYCSTIKDIIQKITIYNNYACTNNLYSKEFKYTDSNNTKRLVEWMFNKYGI